MRHLAAILTIFCVLAAPAWAAEPIFIGAFLPMTGNVAAYGQMGWSGITVARKMEPAVLDRNRRCDPRGH